MERVLAEGHKHDQQLQEHLAQQLAHTLGTTVSNRLDKVLREEMKKSVPQSKLLTIKMQKSTQLNNRVCANVCHIIHIFNSSQQRYFTLVFFLFVFFESINKG